MPDVCVPMQNTFVCILHKSIFSPRACTSRRQRSPPALVAPSLCTSAPLALSISAVAKQNTRLSWEAPSSARQAAPFLWMSALRQADACSSRLTESLWGDVELGCTDVSVELRRAPKIPHLVLFCISSLLG